MTYQPRKIASAEAPSRKRAPARRDPLLSIVVPVKNEEESVFAFVDRVAPTSRRSAATRAGKSCSSTTAAPTRRWRPSPRRTWPIRASARCRLSRNFGKEAALSAGLDHARGRAVVPMDVDMQDPPEVLAEMVAKWREGFDMVYGVRR